MKKLIKKYMKQHLPKVIVALLIMAMLTTVACNKKTDDAAENESDPSQEVSVNEKETKTPEVEIATKTMETEKVETEEAKAEAYSKFSGMPTTNEINSRIPIMVMLDNSPEARMHAGIHQADMVFEMRVEGTYTRYMALFHSQDAELLGPIRSARKYYIERMQEFDAGYAHVGGSSEATEILAGGNYNDLDAMFASESDMWRYNDTGKYAPHNMYSTVEALRNFAERRGYEMTTDKPGYSFNLEAQQPNGEAAERVEVVYFADNISEFNYNSETGKYSLTKDGVEQVDENDQLPFEISNIIIQKATYHPHATIGGILSLDNLGEGTGYYVSQGKYIPITWSKQDYPSKTEYFVDGEELKFNPGQTWVLVVGDETSVDIK